MDKDVIAELRRMGKHRVKFECGQCGGIKDQTGFPRGAANHADRAQGHNPVRSNICRACTKMNEDNDF